MLSPASRGVGEAGTVRPAPMAAARGRVVARRRLSAARSRRTAWASARAVRAWAVMVVAWVRWIGAGFVGGSHGHPAGGTAGSPGWAPRAARDPDRARSARGGGPRGGRRARG